MLLELAIGDVYGAAFEYANRQLIRQFNDLPRYHKHPRHSIGPGRYTEGWGEVKFHKFVKFLPSFSSRPNLT